MSAGLKKMKEHVRAVSNIKKITTSMKAVAASKFARSEKMLRGARPLGTGANRFYIISEFKKETPAPHTSVLALTSDRGLCGAMNAKVCKSVRDHTSSLIKDKRNYDIVCIGEKAKSILSFEHGHFISLVVNGIGHRAPSFADASRIITKVFKNDVFMQGEIVFPFFTNMVSFEIKTLTLYSLPFLLGSKAFLVYEVDEQELNYYLEFSQVVILYYAMSETFLVELAQRISAMSNASKNASTMTSKLQLQMNRKRQQLVTTELTDIVSGAQVIVKK